MEFSKDLGSFEVGAKRIDIITDELGPDTHLKNLLKEKGIVWGKNCEIIQPYVERISGQSTAGETTELFQKVVDLAAARATALDKIVIYKYMTVFDSMKGFADSTHKEMVGGWDIEYQTGDKIFRYKIFRPSSTDRN